MGDKPPGGSENTIGDLERAKRCHRQNRLAEAEGLYLRVLQSRPDDPEVLHYLGVLKRQQGHLDAGIALIRKSLQIQPENAVAWYNLGHFLGWRGNMKDAAAAYQQCLRRDGRNTAALLNLGEIFRLQRDYDRAKMLFEKAAQTAPDSAMVLMNLGNIHFALGDLEQAVAYYRQAIEKDPDKPQIYQNLAAALKSLGDLAGAENNFRKAISLNRRLLEAGHNLAHLKACRVEDPDLQHLFALENDPGLSLKDQGLLFFTLGKICADSDQHDRAFFYYEKGNAVRRKIYAGLGGGFDPAAHSRYVDRLLRVFGPPVYQGRQVWGSNSEKPLLVVGMPRSGTTLVEQILASHEQVWGAGELKILLLLQQQAGKLEELAALDQTRLSALAEAYLQELEKAGGPRNRVVDKMPENFLRLGFFSLLFPRARIIHCRRHPLDTCLSCYFHNFGEGHEYTDSLAHLGSFYADYRRLMDHWQAVLPNPILELSYEKLLDDPRGTTRELLSFCGLEWEDNCLKFYENKRTVRTASNVQVRRPLYQSSRGRWRSYERHLGPLQKYIPGAG